MTMDTARWQERLDQLAGKHGVVGAQLGLLLDGEMSVVATGSANRAEDIDVTPDTLFQLGSISKVLTATMIMQLVDEGLLSLDEPVAAHLPDVPLRDVTVTCRHLLSHTGGIDGDAFIDTGAGADALEKYAAATGDVAQNHPVGATMSYSNSGYALLGRVIEVVGGAVYDDALQTRLAGPLGLTRTWTLPSDVIRYRNAIGHLEPTPGADLVGSPMWGIPRSMGPAGAVNAPVTELLTFAQLHLDDGVARDGRRLLSQTSAVAMRTSAVRVPDQLLADSWGLGWILWEWEGREIYGHDGSTFGQNAYLRIVPDRRLIIGLLTNGGHCAELFNDLLTEILVELAQLKKPELPRPDADLPFEALPYLGTYERAGALMSVAERDGNLELTVTVTGPMAAMMPEPTTVSTMHPYAPDVFLIREPGAAAWSPVVFYDVEGAGRYVHHGVRATPRIGT